MKPYVVFVFFWVVVVAPIVAGVHILAHPLRVEFPSAWWDSFFQTFHRARLSCAYGAARDRCSCNVAVYVSDIKKCYIKHLPAAAGPPGQGGKIHTAVQCTPTCPAPPSPPGPGPPGPPPAPTGTLWKADVSAIPGITDITALFVDGQRGIRARYPK